MKQENLSELSGARVLLELHVPDLEVAEGFYERLGFSVVRREEHYLVMEYGGTVIHFYGGTDEVSQHSYFQRFPEGTARGYGVEVVVFVDDVKVLWEGFRGSDMIVAPLCRRPWGAEDFRIADPFGFYLRISEPYESRECWISAAEGGK